MNQTTADYCEKLNANFCVVTDAEGAGSGGRDT